MIKKLTKKLMLSLVAVFSFAFVTAVHAAADSDLTATLASSTSMVTDNKATILSYIVGIGVIVLVIGLAKAGVIMAIKWVKKAFGGGKRR